MRELIDTVLIDMYENWFGKDRLTLSRTPSLVQLCRLNKSIKYYVEHNLLSYPYDLVDCEDLRGLEWHIEHYYNMYKEDEQC
mgnify:FL=1